LHASPQHTWPWKQLAQSKNHLAHSRHLIAKIRTGTHRLRSGRLLDDQRFLCDEILVERRLGDRHRGPGVPAPGSHLPDSRPNYDRHGAVAIFWLR
jgi:hypothetical protein